MTRIVLNDEQAKLARLAKSVELQDASGNLIGRYVLDDLEEDFRIARERLANKEETFTTQEVLDYLRSLAPE